MFRNTIISGLVLIVSLCLCAKACTARKSSNTKIGSSNYDVFIMNAPSNLTATAVSLTQINLSWQDNSDNEDGFEIERSTDSVIYNLLATLNANTISYADSGLVPFVAYYYRVRAYNTIGDRSSYSNVVGATLQPDSWSTLSAGETYSLALTTNGTLWGWGNNSLGQIDPTNYDPFLRPTLLNPDTDWSKISAGYYHTLAIKASPAGGGTLWSWGTNDSGQLGLGNINPINSFSLVGTNSDWSCIATGEFHSLALKTNQTMWSWGENTQGQLGLGDSGLPPFRSTPTQVGTESDWCAITSGGRHSLAIKTNNTLWTWGWNFWGQLGIGGTLIWYDDTESWIMTPDYQSRTTPSQVGTDSDWRAVSTGFIHAIALKTSGSLWNWGRSMVSDAVTTPIQTGNDTDWSEISAGTGYLDGGYLSVIFQLARKQNGTLWSWGYNGSGQLGLGDTNNRISPAQIQGVANWKLFSAGGYHSIAVADDNQLRTWGSNGFGQLGIGRTGTYINYPINPNFAGPSDLKVNIVSGTETNLIWKDNSYQEVGFKVERKTTEVGIWNEINTVNTNTTLYSDITVTPGNTYYYRIQAYDSLTNSNYSNEVSTIPAVPGNLTLTMLYPSQIKLMWNDNNLTELGFKLERKVGVAGSYGEIGTVGPNVTSYTDTDVQAENSYYYRLRTYNVFSYSPYSNETCITASCIMANVLAGAYHSIGITTNGIIYSWGNNEFGQLGTGDTEDKNLPVIISTESNWAKLSVGANHNFLITLQGVLWSWGYNGYGQLGNSDLGNVYEPTMIPEIDEDDENKNWTTIAAGHNHSIGLKTDGFIWAWGYNEFGQLGLGDNEDKEKAVMMESETGWSVIAAGKNHTMGIKSSGTMWSWGDNDYGQLGLGDGELGADKNVPTQIGTDSDWSKIALGADHSIALKSNGTIWSWGYNEFGQLGLSDNDNKTEPVQIGEDSDWSKITCGFYHSVALKTNRTLWTWGFNEFGQLGLDDSEQNMPISIGTASDWMHISAGKEHTFGLKTNNALWSWGRNNYGQLGLGDTVNRTTPAFVGE